MIKKMNVLAGPAILRLLLALAALSLAACGGSSGGGNSSGSGSNVTTVTGVVTDPAIAGSAVRLVDGVGDALTRIVVTGDDGRFTFNLPASKDMEGVRVVAVGGSDVATGQDLSGITLSAAYREGETVVSPLSTLALAYQDDGGSLEGFASLVGLNEDIVLANPSASVDSQKVSMLLTELMVALKGTGVGHARLLEEVEMAGGDLAVAADNLAAEEDMPAPTVARLQAVSRRIAAIENLAEVPVDAAGMVAELNRLNIRDGVASYLEANLGFTAGTEAQEANIDNLSSAIFEALDGNGLAADSAAILNIARYVVVANGLDASVLAADTFKVPQPIDPENLLPLLAETDSLESTLPLAAGEELGSDNAARVDYFFRTELSPYYRAAKLFDGVIDDQILDPVYVSIVRGLADAGFIEQAELTAQASIFQASQKGEAFQEIGRALDARDDVEGAVVAWDKALDLYNGYLETLEDENGVPLISANDASFYQSLSGDFRDAGYPEKAEDVMEGVNSYIASQEGQPYSTAYGRLAVGAGYNAEALVLGAVEAGLTGKSFTIALDATEFFHDVVSSMGPRDSDDFCYSLKTSQLSGVAELYQMLGETDQALAVLDEYEALADVECNDRAVAVYADNFADVYGSLGLLERYQDFLAAEVRPYDEANDRDYESGALARVSVYQALEVAKSEQEGKIDSAVAIISESTDDLADVVELLTYIGTGRNDGGRHYLARLLWDNGYEEEALAVADAAFDLTVSAEFAESETRPSSFIGQGCRKVAKLYEWLGQPDTALSRMDECASVVQNRLDDWSTDRQAEAYALLAESYQFLGAYEKSLVYVPSWNTLIEMMGDASDQAYEKTQVAIFAANAADFELASRSLKEASALAASIASETDEQGLIEDGVDEFIDVAEYQQETLDIIRGRISGNGIVAGEPQAAEEARAQLRKGLIGEDGKSGALLLIAAINDPEDREDYMQDVIGLLAGAQFFEDAESLARDASSVSGRNERLALVAEGYAGYDDYPGSTIVRFDFDKDGLPDFYSPVSTQQERDSLAVSLDDDIDGDGNAAADDPTPYCATCEI